jgi:flavin reductase (DIM6/NTAB) family NADH-FMN oxidoreductase RutF
MLRVNESEFMQFEPRKKARFINSLTGFKSVHLIGTQSQSAVSNLSIISSAIHLSSNPPMMAFVIRPDVVQRDTLENIRETGYCTLNHIHAEFLEKAHQASARYDKEINEFQECELSEEHLNQFPAPFVNESQFKLALKFIREIDIPENKTHLMLMKIQDVYLPKEILDSDGFIDYNHLENIVVAGLDTYYQPTRIKRLSYAKPFKDLKTIE